MKVVHRKKTEKEIFLSRLRFVRAMIQNCAMALANDAANNRDNWMTIERYKALIADNLEPLVKAGRLSSYIVRTYDGSGDSLEKHAANEAILAGAMALGSIMLFWWIDKEFVVKEQ